MMPLCGGARRWLAGLSRESDVPGVGVIHLERSGGLLIGGLLVGAVPSLPLDQAGGEQVGRGLIVVQAPFPKRLVDDVASTFENGAR